MNAKLAATQLDAERSPLSPQSLLGAAAHLSSLALQTSDSLLLPLQSHADNTVKEHVISCAIQAHLTEAGNFRAHT